MKQVKIIVALLLLSFGTFAQTVTPNPGPYTPMAQKYQYPWIKTTGGVWNTGKFVQIDSAQFSGITYVPDAPVDDSSTQAANTRWIRQNISPGTPGTPTSVWQFLGNYSPTDPTLGRIGFIDSFPLSIITDNEIRITIPDNGIKRSAGLANKVLMIDTITKNVYYADAGGGGGSTIDSTTLSDSLAYYLPKSDTTAMLANYNDSIAAHNLRIIANTTAIGGKVDTATAVKYNFTSLRNNDLLKYDSINNRFINFRLNVNAPLLYNYSTNTISADTATALTGLATKANVGSGGGGTPAGATTEIQYNNAGAFGASSTFTYNPSAIPSSAIAKGLYVASIMTATDNSDTLVGIDINPTFTNGAYTGVKNYSARINGALVFKTGVNNAEPLSIYGSSNRLYMIGGNAGSGQLDIAMFDHTGGYYFGIRNDGATVLNSNLISSFYGKFGGVQIGGSGNPQASIQTGAWGLTSIGYAGSYADNGIWDRTGESLIGIKNGGNVVIGLYSSTYSASAKLDIVSTTKGFLPPRMTTTQKTAITSPATGLMVYDTTLNKLCVYTGAAWETITSL
jgi:hypothetical protein